MAKGSVRKKGKKWYYRFYIEDESGNRIQKEYPGTESKSETEKLLRQAMEDYDAKRFVAKTDNITVAEMLDIWSEEELKTGTLSNGTVENYLLTINRIKQHPISRRKLKTVTPEHLQQFIDLLVFGGTAGDFISKGYTKDYIHSYTAVLQQMFRFAVFPKKLITFNPMQYVVQKKKAEDVDLFANEANENGTVPLTPELFIKLINYLKEHNKPAVLPIQIAYYTGLRIGEVCGLTWQDIDLSEQYLTVRRSVRYNGATHKTEIGPTKRKKVRTVDFCDTLADILRAAKTEQIKAKLQYGALYKKNYYKTVKEKNRLHYELYHFDGSQEVSSEYSEISLVCLRPDGAFESPSTLGIVCRRVREILPGFETFHFHALRHTYTTNLLSHGASPKDVQELLGHSDVNTTMNVYAHATREDKRASARLLDKVAVS